MLISRFWRAFAIAGLALLANGAFAQSKPREVTPPIDITITLQVGETRVFQFRDAVNRIGLSDENIVEAKSGTGRIRPLAFSKQASVGRRPNRRVLLK